MAEVRQCFGRGAQDVALKLYSSCLLESPNKHGTSAVHASWLSAGVLLDDIKNCDLNRGGKVDDGAAAGACRDGYTRLKRPVAQVDPENGQNVKSYYSRGLGKQSLSSQRRLQLLDSSARRYRNSAKFCGTSSNSYRCPGHLYPGQGRFVPVREYGSNGTRPEPLYRTKTGYYEVLEVSPSATHAQIKTAYYKQSFVYHPDRNAGSDAATARFSEISEAYTVLGNTGLRRKYDRGLLGLSDLTAAIRPSAKDSAGGPGRQPAGSRRTVAGADSRGGVSDFDEFYRSYYSEQLQRQRDIRVRKDEILKRQQETVGDRELGKMSEIGIMVLLLLGIGMLMSLKRS